ncbi:MAG UNVERIFIED_CONTAM: hypothetical protein LVT10_17980 [Anaerolineae bacterium]
MIVLKYLKDVRALGSEGSRLSLDSATPRWGRADAHVQLTALFEVGMQQPLNPCQMHLIE